MKRIAVTAALLTLYAVHAGAQATATVPPNDPVYGFIDRLVAERLVERVIVGQRSMSRREIGRILREASGNVPGSAGDSTNMLRTLAAYRLAYADSVVATHAESYSGEIAVASSPSRGIPPDGNGAIDVAVNPLFANRLARPLSDGVTLNGVVHMDGPLARWLTIAATGRASGLAGKGSQLDHQLFFEQAYARALFANVAVQIGRDYEFLGQGANAGLSSSLNPRAFDLVRITSDAPFILPSLLRYAGPIKATISLADLGANQLYPHARLLQYKLSARPNPAFELGATVSDEVGGQGAPGGTFAQKATDAFPLIDALFLHRNFLFSNKFVGMDARLTVPGVNGVQVYMEGMFDDFDARRIRSVFTEDAGYVWGASLLRSARQSTTRISGEYHVTGIRYYTHGVFRSGYTLDRQFIGDPLGPRGKAGYLTVDFDRFSHGMSVEVAHEVRSADKYGSVSPTANDADFRFVILEHHPAERRWRAMFSWRGGKPGHTVARFVNVGVETVEDRAVVSGRTKNMLIDAGFEIRPKRPMFR